MKKRVKLLTTIASLCLAVALMAFGVYAATQSTLTVNSTISFTSTDVKVLWTWEVTGGNITAADASVTSGSYEAKTEGVPTDNKEVTLGKLVTQGEDTTTGAISFDTSKVEGKTITYTIICQNTSAEAVKVTTAGTLFVGDSNLEIKYYVDDTDKVQAWNDYGDNDTDTEVKADAKAFYELTAADAEGKNGGKVTFIVKVTLKDATLDIADQTMKPTFTAEKA